MGKKGLWLGVLLGAVLALCGGMFSVQAYAAGMDGESSEEENHIVTQDDVENTVPLSAGERGRGTVEDLEGYWLENGYPEYVSFAYEAGGEVLEDGTVEHWWEVGVVDAGGDEREEILSLAAPGCVLTFQECHYPYAERAAVYEEILEKYGDAVTVVMGRNTEWIHIAAPGNAEGEAPILQQIAAEYGSVINIPEGGFMGNYEEGANDGAAGLVEEKNSITSEFSGSLKEGLQDGIKENMPGNALPALPGPAGQAGIQEPGSSRDIAAGKSRLPVWVMPAACAVLAGGILFLLSWRLHRRAVRMGVGGKALEAEKPALRLGRREIEAAVGSSKAEPGAQVFSSMVKKLEGEGPPQK